MTGYAKVVKLILGRQVQAITVNSEKTHFLSEVRDDKESNCLSQQTA